MTGVELADSFSEFVNGMDRTQAQEFVDKALRDHPTLQQSMMRLMIQLIDGFSKMTRVDMRNETAKEVAAHVIDEAEHHDLETEHPKDVAQAIIDEAGNTGLPLI